LEITELRTPCEKFLATPLLVPRQILSLHQGDWLHVLCLCLMIREFTGDSRCGCTWSYAYGDQLLPRQPGRLGPLRRHILRSTKLVDILVTVLGSWESKSAFYLDSGLASCYLRNLYCNESECALVIISITCGELIDHVSFTWSECEW